MPQGAAELRRDALKSCVNGNRKLCMLTLRGGKPRAAPALHGFFLSTLAGWLLAAPPGAMSAASGPAPQRQAFFGDLHVHTMYSMDAFSWSVRATPDDAHRFAKGEAIIHRDGRSLRLRGPRLDFLAVTDHAEYLGLWGSLLDPASPFFKHPDKKRLLSATSVDGLEEVLALLEREGSTLLEPELLGDAWRRSVAAAQRHNQPGEFTAFIGYEFTGVHHRNVIFKDGGPSSLPFSSLDSQRPEDLWRWMDEQRAAGVEALAIPHSGNRFNMLWWNAYGGGRVTLAQAQQRRRHEPLVEIYQQKGSSATHPLLSVNDEWADFSIRRHFRDDRPQRVGAYWRSLLGQGMVFEERLGVNPHQLGAAGGSDSHYAAGTYDERDVNFGRSPQDRGSVFPEALGGWEGFQTPTKASHVSGGLTGVWAEENTRAALFAAMRRRETFATSGPRIRLRLFGGFGLVAQLADADDRVAVGYRRGVPMGQVLPRGDQGGGGAPSFFAWAMRDPASGRLQRLQVVKGELESAGSEWLYRAVHTAPGRVKRLGPVREYLETAGAQVQEWVFDLACSDGGRPDPATHRCPDNGAAVNLADCSVSANKGAGALQALWTDPDFDPDRRSYYYLRALENPSCRWSSWEALRHGVPPNPDLPPTVQERAWSSPIWYSPAVESLGRITQHN